MPTDELNEINALSNLLTERLTATEAEAALTTIYKIATEAELGRVSIQDLESKEEDYKAEIATLKVKCERLTAYNDQLSDNETAHCCWINNLQLETETLHSSCNELTAQNTEILEKLRSISIGLGFSLCHGDGAVKRKNIKVEMERIESLLESSPTGSLNKHNAALLHHYGAKYKDFAGSMKGVAKIMTEATADVFDKEAQYILDQLKEGTQ